jgi:hypothetical protein
MLPLIMSFSPDVYIQFQVYHNANYGLDPHTGTHDMIIRRNIVHDNGAQGIISSLNCYNVLTWTSRMDIDMSIL